MQQFQDGQTIDVGGKTLKRVNGRWVDANASVPIYGAPPKVAPVAPYAAEDQAIQRETADRAGRDEARAEAIQPYTERKAIADAIKAERGANTPDPEEAERRVADNIQIGNLSIIAKRLNRVQELYNQDLKGVSLGKSVGQLVSTPKIQRFQSASKSLAVILKPLIRGPSEGAWTDKDQAILDRLVPTQYTSDADNEERINSAKEFIAAKAAQAGGRGRRVPIASPKSGGFQILGFE